MELDQEMANLERERLKEKQRIREMEWRESEYMDPGAGYRGRRAEHDNGEVE